VAVPAYAGTCDKRYSIKLKNLCCKDFFYKKMFFIENVVIYVHFTIGQGMILAKHCPIGRGMIFLKFENWIFDAKSLKKKTARVLPCPEAHFLAVFCIVDI
jgi:hypothetical protein